jgi:hypothetical protein
LLGPAQRDFQTVSQVVGNVIPAHRQHAGVLDDAVGINDVLGRAAAEVDDQRAEFLLLVGEQRQGRGQSGKDDFIHFQLQAATTAMEFFSRLTWP